MYTSTDLSIIHCRYFTVLRLSEDDCELQSNCTGHCWYISQSQDGYFLLQHKHRLKENYHVQTAGSFEDCILAIVDHDDYQLRGRQPAFCKRENSFFDQILKAYEHNETV